MLAHLAGIPVEETALSLAPLLAATGGVVGIALRGRFSQRQSRRPLWARAGRRRR